jgi:hypothetical protein
MNIPGLQPDGSPYPPITGKRSIGSIGIVEGGMEYMQTAAGRDNWTCEIAAKDVADFVAKKHVAYWEESRNKHPKGSSFWHEAVPQIQYWETWHDFLLTIEPNVKLRLTIDDYRFFYFGVGEEREGDA